MFHIGSRSPVTWPPGGGFLTCWPDAPGTSAPLRERDCVSRQVAGLHLQHCINKRGNSKGTFGPPIWVRPCDLHPRTAANAGGSRGGEGDWIQRPGKRTVPWRGQILETGEARARSWSLRDASRSAEEGGGNGESLTTKCRPDLYCREAE